jgi:hypothetical protein
VVSNEVFFAVGVGREKIEHDVDGENDVDENVEPGNVCVVEEGDFVRSDNGAV